MNDRTPPQPTRRPPPSERRSELPSPPESSRLERRTAPPVRPPSTAAMPNVRPPSTASMPRAPGHGQAGANVEGNLVVDAGMLVARLVDLLRSPGYQPPLLPAVALELLDLARRPDTTVRQIDALLATDPVLAANVLRVANSPAFSPGGKVRSLQDAIVRLGTRTIAAIFFDVWTNAKVFRAPGFEEPMTMVRRHSTAVAHLARLVARYAKVNDDYAYLCGLLHDIGVAIGLLTISEWRGRDAMPDPFELCHALGEGHAEIGATLCAHWKLPSELVQVVRTHHRIVVDGKVQQGAAIVRIADNLAFRHGFGLQIDVEDRSEERLACHALGLTEAAIKALDDEAPLLLAQLE